MSFDILSRTKNKWVSVLNTGKTCTRIHVDSKVEQLKQVALPELSLFDLGTLVNVTNNFDYTNKLGQGVFGPVYKVIAFGLAKFPSLRS